MKTRNYKFRLYPNDSQEKKLQNNLAVCRWIYNKFVEYPQQGIKQTTAGTAGSNACGDAFGIKEARRGHPTSCMVVHRLL